MPFHQDRITRTQIRHDAREDSTARLEAAGIFLIFGIFSAVKLTLAYVKRFARKGAPSETGW
ncbi:hypothetical protein [Azospirillum doebereinerae]|uniref:Uncharacterized protein n=1 Tax=Azospirillum doebereinerae TaxID=92933 RepID=A0A3S1CDM9_9PROT|nr:hypothetical protein [Azospirillum doebereinerae]MCG5244217.1 hypothetical protein [Azospirillum doebereinerae]RUQ63956.1 hypothetical protein EJ913_26880 [Azospirillum doebereinerae]